MKKKLLVQHSSRHCRHSTNRNWMIIIFQFIVLKLSFNCRFQKGAYPEDMHTFCIVPLKLAFFLTVCVFGSGLFFCGVFPQRKIIEIFLVQTREPRPYPLRAQELCESRGGRPGVSIPVSLHGLCARKAALKWLSGLPVPNNPEYGLCRRTATLKQTYPLRHLTLASTH